MHSAVLARSRYDDLVLNTPDLVAYWPLSEGNGTLARDIKGTNHGTYGGGFLLAKDGPDGTRAVSLDGANGTRVRAASITFPASITWEVWTIATAWPTDAAFIGQWKSAGGTTGSMLYGLATGARMYCNITFTPTWAGGVAGTLYHLVGTYDAVNLRLYANGALVSGPTLATAPIAATTTTLEMGTYRDDGGANLNARLSRAAYYSRALDLNEIRAHYFAGIGA